MAFKHDTWLIIAFCTFITVPTQSDETTTASQFIEKVMKHYWCVSEDKRNINKMEGDVTRLCLWSLNIMVR